MCSTSFVSKNLDFLGFSTSAACAVHCAIVPVLASFYGLGKFSFFNSHWLDVAALIFGAAIAICSLLPSYLKKHRNPVALILVTTGLLFLIISKLWHKEILFEITLTTIGAIFIATAHFLNWKLNHKLGIHHS